MLSSDEAPYSGAGVNHVTLLLPVLLLIIAAIVIWLTRARAIRTQWGLSAAMAIVIWIVCLSLRLGPDLHYQLSVWQPIEIFSTPLSLSLDSISWPILYALVTVLVAMIFTAASRQMATATSVRIFWFIYSASAVLAILADNLLTVLITWTLFDFISAIFLFTFLRSEDEIRQVLTRLSIDLLGTLLILGGSAVSIAAGFGVNLTDPLHAPLSVFLLALGSFVRLGLLPLHFNLPALLALRRGFGTLLRLFPPAIVLSFLARLFMAGIPDQTLPWFMIAGVSGSLIGGLRWMLESETIVGRPYFILAMSGVGVLAGAMLPQEYSGIVSACVVLLLAGAVLSLTVVHTPSQRVLSLGAVLVLLGIPGLPASVLTMAASQNIIMLGLGLVWALILIVAMSMVALGCLHLYFAEETPWQSSESLVRITYSLGLSLPVFTSIGIGLQLRPEIGLWTWILLALQIVLVAIGYLVLRKLPEGSIGRFRFNLSRLDPTRFYVRMGKALDVLSRAIQSIAGLIEGEAALLWIFAIVAFLLLAS
ncbi:MAG: hypothetical protein E4G99_07090 [Anaerolineales bacterium]|nr:MAG: hypothetical protein E4G99_07090 [Anaerolineales bacterium]